MEGENASGHRGQEEGEAEAEGELAVGKTLLLLYICLASQFIVITFNGSRNRNEAWKAGQLSMK